jgi:hypothetical protein
MPKPILRIIPALLICLAAALPLTASASDYAVTGGSNGPGCSDGGYFSPPSITVPSGSTITFSVPSNDPYYAGLQVMGFPEGTFVIAKGGQHTTAPLTSSVNYHATWPSQTSCPKGTGSVTVTAAPTPTPTPTPAPVTGGAKSTPTPKANATATPAPSPSPSASAPPATSPSAEPSPSVTASPSPSPVAAHTGPAQTNVLSYATAGGGLLLLLVIGGLLWLRHRARLKSPPPGSPPSPLN